MAVELTGPDFDIVSLQVGAASEQVLRPLARWQFDVTPQRSGIRVLQLRVAMRIPMPGRLDERLAIPA